MSRLILLIILLVSVPLAWGHEYKANKTVVTISDDGSDRKEIILKKRDSSVFFLNSTSEEEVSIEVVIGKRIKHCWTPNFEVTAEGNLATKEPLSPNDFATLCLADPGKYQVKVRSKRLKEDLVVVVGDAV